jgi:hypothetical protein
MADSTSSAYPPPVVARSPRDQVSTPTSKEDPIGELLTTTVAQSLTPTSLPISKNLTDTLVNTSRRSTNMTFDPYSGPYDSPTPSPMARQYRAHAQDDEAGPVQKQGPGRLRKG